MGTKRALSFIFAGLVVSGSTVGSADTGAPEFRSAGSRQNTILQDPCAAVDFPPIQLAFASNISERLPGTTTGIRCVAEVRNQGEPQRGVPLILGGALLDGDGNPISTLPTRTGTTNRAGQKTFTFPYTVPPSGSDLVVLMEGHLEGDDEVDLVDTTCGIIQRTPCNNTKTQACLSGKRFKVEVSLPGAGDGGAGQLISANKREALFYFFSPGSTDLLVELLQRCANNDHFWVFAAATTNIEFDLTVTDTFTGESRAYENPGALQPILDTSAFATCP